MKNNNVKLAYNLLSDLEDLEKSNILDEKDLKAIYSSKLSHKYIKSVMGRFYLRYYYSPMISSAMYTLGSGVYLELGCGTGTQCILAERLGFECVSGFDLISERIRIAKKRRMHYLLDDKINFEVGDFWKMNIGAPATSIYSMFAFELFGSPATSAAQRLDDLCADHAKIVLDMGRVRPLYRSGYFSELSAALEDLGFLVKIEPLYPFLVGSMIQPLLGRLGLWAASRAIRLTAIR